MTPGEPENDALGQLGGTADTAEKTRASQKRDDIAAAMWEDYQKLKGRRRIEVLNSVF